MTDSPAPTIATRRAALRTAAADTPSSARLPVEHGPVRYAGVQFHPESVLASRGKRPVANVVNSCGAEDV